MITYMQPCNPLQLNYKFNFKVSQKFIKSILQHITEFQNLKRNNLSSFFYFFLLFGKNNHIYNTLNSNRYSKHFIQYPELIIYLEIVKWALRNIIIKLLHWVPWSIPHPNHNYRERIMAVCQNATDQDSKNYTLTTQDYWWYCFT